MATMDDIARALGISKGTVSKALSGAQDIGEATRRRVVECAVEMGYSRLSRNEKKRLGIFVAHMAFREPEDFGYEFVSGFRKLAEPSGFSVEIIELERETQTRYAYDEYMMRQDLRGALFLGLNDLDPWKEQIRTCRTPTVLYDNLSYENPVVTQIGVDNIEAMHKSVDYLKSLGHTRIGYLSSGDPYSFIYQQRREAFFLAMKAEGLETDEALAGVEPFTVDCIQSQLPRLLKAGCTAVICNHDMLAVAVITHCTESGIRIPEDLSVVGFDDLPLCEMTKPPLTTIRQDRGQLGRSAFYALTSLLEKTPISLLMLHPELRVRGSAGAKH